MTSTCSNESDKHIDALAQSIEKLTLGSENNESSQNKNDDCSIDPKNEIKKEIKDFVDDLVSNIPENNQQYESSKTKVSKTEQSETRYFEAIHNGTIVGRYSGKTPKQTANKAFMGIARQIHKENPSKADKILSDGVEFAIHESTRKSRGKTFIFKCKREPLEMPVAIALK